MESSLTDVWRDASPSWVYDETFEASLRENCDREDIARQGALRKRKNKSVTMATTKYCRYMYSVLCDCVAACEIGSIESLNEQIGAADKVLRSNCKPLVFEKSLNKNNERLVQCDQMAGRAATKKKLSVSESGKTCSETVCDTKHQQVDYVS